MGRVPPNMRLKLSGAIVLWNQSVCALARTKLSFNTTAPYGHVACSLRAIRKAATVPRRHLP